MEDQTEQIRLLKEQLAAKNEELQTCQEELAVAKESMSSIESQLRTVRLESEVEKLRAVEQLRQHGDVEIQLLQADKDKEIARISVETDQLKSLNKTLMEEVRQLREQEQVGYKVVDHWEGLAAEDEPQDRVSNIPLPAQESQTIGDSSPLVILPSMDAPMLQSSVEVESTHSHVESTHSTTSKSPEVMQQVTELLQAQRDMMAAQIKKQLRLIICSTFKDVCWRRDLQRGWQLGEMV